MERKKLGFKQIKFGKQLNYSITIWCGVDKEIPTRWTKYFWGTSLNLGPPKNILSLGFEFPYLLLTIVIDYMSINVDVNLSDLTTIQQL